MARGRKDRIQAIIESLNSIQVGELSVIETKLGVARADLLGIGEGELEQVLGQATGHLGKGELQEFRRLVAQVVARLGHLH